jgi:DNA-3-methyladenine glycosylase
VARLPRAFFVDEPTVVAPALLGRVVVRRLDDGTVLRARLVETEAYDQDDPASHSFRGPTARARVMFGPPGRLYVYFTYGMHWCMNVVTGAEGVGSAVLLRAAELLAEPSDELVDDRDRDRCRGPARLARTLRVDGSLDGADLVRGSPIWLEEGDPVPAGDVAVGPRVGVSSAADRPWRVWESGSEWVSPWRPGRHATGRAPAGRPRRGSPPSP